MSSTSLAIRYIKSHPFLEDYLHQGIVNYSAVARLLHKRYPASSEAAIGMALRRFAARKHSQKRIESQIRKMLEEARIQIESKISVLVVRRPLNYSVLMDTIELMRAEQGECTMIEGSEVITLIFPSRFVERVQTRLADIMIRIRGGMSKVVLTIDNRLEETLGVVSFVYGQLSKAGVNIREEMSCWTDIMIVLDEADVGKAISILTAENS
jgi:hypothetical protein